jgi:hypothetical protein
MLPTGPREELPERPAPPRPDDRAVAAAAGGLEVAAAVTAEPPSLEARPTGPVAPAPQPAGDALLGKATEAPTMASPPRWRGAALAIATVVLLAMLGVGVFLGIDALRQTSGAPPQSSLTPFPSSSASGLASPTPSSIASPTPSGIATATPSGTASATPSRSPSPTSSIVPATVPNLIGLSVERATERIEAAGLVVGTVTTVSGPADTVVSCDPTPGEAVVSGATVNLSVGDGSSG